MTATEQLDRLLLLLAKLESRGTRRIVDLAEELKVSPKTLRKDLETIVSRDHAEPAGFMEAITISIDGENVSVERRGRFGRPMALTRPEAMALDLALALLLSEYPRSDHAAIASARAKLRHIRLDGADPQAAAVAVRIGQVDEESRRHRALLEQCSASHRLATIEYLKPAALEPTSRIVGPLGLVCVRGHWHLFARNGPNGEVRQFRLDRIRNVEVHAETFVAPSDFDLEAVLQDGRAFLGQPTERVCIRYRGPAARWVAEDEGGSLEADGTLTKEYPLADLDWPLRQVLRWGENAEVIEPFSVRERIVARLAVLSANRVVT